MPMRLHIRQFFCAMLLLAAFGAQHGHGLVHLAEVFNTHHCRHEPTQSKHELSHEHDAHESQCGICQFQFSPSFPALVTGVSFASEIFCHADQILSGTTLRDTVCGGILSNRGPPVALI